MSIYRGEIWMLNFEPRRGSEQGGHRPAIIIQTDLGNHAPGARTTIVVPLTTQGRGFVFYVPIPKSRETGLGHDSWANCTQLFTVDRGRLEKRLQELKLEAQIAPLPPVILGGVLVIPAGLLAAMPGQAQLALSRPIDTQVSAARARAVVVEIERSLGFDPTDREFEKLGYDVESRVPGTGKLRFIEVKGRVSGAATITVTKNEILYSLNKPDDFILAIVEFTGDDTHRAHYLRRPFQREPDFGVTSVNYDFADLLARAEAPR